MDKLLPDLKRYRTPYDEGLRRARRMDLLVAIAGWAVAGGIVAVFWWALAVMW